MRTVPRTAVLPVVEPVGVTWEELDASLVTGFRLATELYNWTTQELLLRDERNTPQTPSCVKYKSQDNPEGCAMYAEARNRFPDWANRTENLTASANEIVREVHRKYLKNRYAIHFRHEQRLTTYSYPQPFPFHNATWEIKYSASGHPTVKVNLPDLPQVRLRLEGSGEFHYQLDMLAQLYQGQQLADLQEKLRKPLRDHKAKPTPALARKIASMRREIEKFRNDHPMLAEKGKAALFRNSKGKLMFAMSGHFPFTEKAPGQNVCFLHTDPASLLVAEVNGRRVSILNGDHLKRMHAIILERASRHKRFLQRIGEDRKREVRQSRKQRVNLKEYSKGRCEKQKRRMTSALFEIAAQVARFCERQKVGLIAYDDHIKSFIPDGFQWFVLKQKIHDRFVGKMNGQWIDAESAGGPYSHVDSAQGNQERREWLHTVQATAQAGLRATEHMQRKGSHPAVTPNSLPKTSPPDKTKRKNAKS